MKKEELRHLLSEMSLEEKVFQLVQVPGGTFFQDVEDTGTAVENAMSEQQLYMVGSTLSIKGAEQLNDLQRKYMERQPHHIPMLAMLDVIHGYRTVFPMTLAQGASFDTALAEEGAKIAACEASAGGIHVTFSPMVDVTKDARWGRILESPGEDPYLNSRMAEAMVYGFQGTGENAETEPGAAEGRPYPKHVSACIKHFAAYGAPEAGREYNTTELTDYTLNEFYLPPYEAGVRAGSDMIMTSFNALNGRTASGNRRLLRDLLRNEWGFDGVVISDWNAVGELVNHGLCGSLREAAKMAIEAGVDIDMCSGAYAGYLCELVESGEVAESLVDESVLRVLELKNRLGLFEHPYKDSSAAAEKAEILSPEKREAARRAVPKCSVLLKNAGSRPLLPLEKGKNIALIGPYVESRELHSSWSIIGEAADAVSVREAAQELEQDYHFTYTQGCVMTCREDYAGTAWEPNVERMRLGLDAEEPAMSEQEAELSARFIGNRAAAPDAEEQKRMLQAAADAAAAADTAVVFIGEHRMMSGESASRAEITVPQPQMDLLRKVHDANPNTAVVLFTGRPLDLREVCTNAASVLVVWMPGTEGGHGIMDMLSGKVSPSGKLPASFPYCVGQVPISYNQFSTGRAKPAGQKNPYYTSCYIDIPNRPLFPFGYGLSYTSFSYSPVTLTHGSADGAAALAPGGQTGEPALCVSRRELKEASVTAQVTVKNTGSVAADETVQLYIHDVVASLTRPVKALKGFCRITLQPGEEKTVSFPVSEEALSFRDQDGTLLLENGDFEVFAGPDSETHEKALLTLTD